MLHTRKFGQIKPNWEHTKSKYNVIKSACFSMSGVNDTLSPAEPLDDFQLKMIQNIKVYI